jgi:translation initiation factor 4E
MSTGVSSPSTNASSAFGLGSGAFASFGAPKTPGGSDLKTPGEKRDFSTEQEEAIRAKDMADSHVSGPGENPLKSTWIVWYRPPTPKYSDYEKSTVPLASISSVESFWAVYSHLKRPSLLPTVSDYHIFKKGIRPVWEDEANKRGGKWIVRLKKGVADRYWEDLLLAMVGDQFAEAGDEVCGAVLSVRGGEDVLSVWTRIDGGRNIKIRETIKRLLAFPFDTNIIWKSHDDSIAQRSAIDQARQEKGSNPNTHLGTERRRPTHEDPDKVKGTAM